MSRISTVGATSAVASLLVASAVTVGPAVVAQADTVAAVSGTTLLVGMACSTSSTCVATGQAGSQSSGVVVPITNGSPGSVQQVSGTNELYAAACSSSSTCYAVGVGNFASDGMLVPITNGTAGSALTVTATAFLRGITCANATTCLAVGWETGNYNNGAGRIGVVVPITNGTPGGAQQVPGTLDLDGVACPTSTNCVGVGTAASSPGVSAGAVVAITNGSAAGVQTVSGTDLDAVACPSSSSCLAVGSVPSTGGNAVGAVVPITNGSPGAVQQVSGINNLAGVACPSATSCEAAGWWYASGSTAGVVPITNGTPGAAQQEPATFQLYGVACISDTSCLAAGDNSSNGVGIVVAFSGSGAGVVAGPYFSKEKRDAQADIRPALNNAITFCTPTALGLTGFGAGVLITGAGSGAAVAIAGALTAYATAPFCTAVIKRVVMDYRIYKDPPDPSYTQLAEPAPIPAVNMPSCSRWSGSNLEFCRALSAAEKKWAQAAETLASVDQALSTTMNRESAAVAAKDQNAVTTQDNHLSDLAKQQGSALAAVGSSGKSVAHVLKAHGIGYTLSKDRCRTVIGDAKKVLGKKGVAASALTTAAGSSAPFQPRAINILKALASS